MSKILVYVDVLEISVINDVFEKDLSKHLATEI